MSVRKVLMVAAAVFFLLLGLAGFYRLMFGFQINLGSHHVGHVSSYLVFVVSIALSLFLFRQAKTAH